MKKTFIYVVLGIILMIPITTLFIVYLHRGVQWILAKFAMFFIPNSMIGSATIYFHFERSEKFKKFKLSTNPTRKKRILQLLIISWICESLVISTINCLIPINYSPKARYVFWALQILSLAHSVRLFNCRMPSKFEVLFFSLPYAVAFTGAMISFPLLIPFSLMLASPYIIYLISLPFIISFFAFFWSMKTSKAEKYEKVFIQIAGGGDDDRRNDEGTTTVHRISQFSPSLSYHQSNPPISVIQLTDLHIGSMMSVSRLKYICEEVVKLNPDLVLITGDFYTIEAYDGGYNVPSNSSATIESLSPLRKIAEKCFVCLGNHDIEDDRAFSILNDGLAKLGIKLLVDKQQIIHTPKGKIQLIGLDYTLQNRQKHIQTTLKQFPRQPDIDYRFVMLHDPGGFKYIDPNDGCLVFSGHTHGGQVGWMYGFHLTLVSLIGLPDNGLWANGKNRLYVHRGQGSRSLYGNAIARLGIPNEQSIMYVYKS